MVRRSHRSRAEQGIGHNSARQNAMHHLDGDENGEDVLTKWVFFEK
ncbi:hypothetical protein [Kocuria palustris]|nr:hypothetical protein [Kocuria palustris]